MPSVIVNSFQKNSIFTFCIRKTLDGRSVVFLSVYYTHQLGQVFAAIIIELFFFLLAKFYLTLVIDHIHLR